MGTLTNRVMPGDISLMRGSVPTESAIASNWSLLRKTFPPILGDQDTIVAVHEMTLRTRKMVSDELRCTSERMIDERLCRIYR
jgi:hypothetical protein